MSYPDAAWERGEKVQEVILTRESGRRPQQPDRATLATIAKRDYPKVDISARWPTDNAGTDQQRAGS